MLKHIVALLAGYILLMLVLGVTSEIAYRTARSCDDGSYSESDFEEYGMPLEPSASDCAGAPEFSTAKKMFFRHPLSYPFEIVIGIIASSPFSILLPLTLSIGGITFFILSKKRSYPQWTALYFGLLFSLIIVVLIVLFLIEALL